MDQTMLHVSNKQHFRYFVFLSAIGTRSPHSSSELLMSYFGPNQADAKSLEISPVVGDFYGTENKILADCTGPKFGQHRDHLHCTAK